MGLKILLKTINGGKEGEYKKDFMKIKFNSDIICLWVVDLSSIC